MNSEIWGPHYWYTIHTIALNYPKNPNAIEKKSHYKFIQDLHLFIPNKTSSRNFAYLLKLYPVLPYLDNRKDFVKWTHFIHNRVNESLGKDQISLSEFYIEYFKNNQPKKVRTLEYLKNRKYILYLIILFVLITVTIYISKK